MNLRATLLLQSKTKVKEKQMTNPLKIDIKIIISFKKIISLIKIQIMEFIKLLKIIKSMIQKNIWTCKVQVEKLKILE